MQPKSAYGYGKDFVQSLQKLHRSGGKFQKAAETVFSIMGKLETEPDPFKGIARTNHGESRILHCVKYDLTGFCRLITIKTNGLCALSFVGSHDDCDKWLESNSGKEFRVESNHQVVAVDFPSKTCEPGKLHVPRMDRRVSVPFAKQLSDSELDIVFDGLPHSIANRLSELDSISRPDTLLEILENVCDALKANFLFDVFSALMEANPEQAKRRIKVLTGEILEIVVDAPLTSSEDLQLIPTDSAEYVKLFSHFVQTANYKDWMLFMHPAQKQVMEEDFNGSAKLVGVSGSGKTCIVVKRAVRLAEKYKDRILVLTLNRSLSILINDLVNEACPPELRAHIEVKPFFTLCQEMLQEHEPGNERLYVDVTWKGEEHIDEIWREFYRCHLNNHDAEVLLPVHDSLITQGVHAEDYLRAEFDWIRSAIPPNDREKYLTIERQGRSFGLNKSFRKAVLEGLDAWEKKMKHVGAIDYLGLANALYQHVDKIMHRYRCILIDESQDFGTTELSIVSRLVKQQENNLFLCGDAAQQVSNKFQSLKAADIIVASNRTRKIQKNYRNSREILSAAYGILKSHMSSEGLRSEDFEILDPEYANFSGPSPLLLKASDLSDELNSAIRYTQEEIDRHPTWKACIAFCGYSHYEVQHFGKQYNFSVLDGSKSIDEHNLYFSDLEQSKGFEFDLVIILNASHAVIPNPKIPDVEKLRDLARLYVAMTRAKWQLIVSYSDTPSKYFDATSETFESGIWFDYLEVSAPISVEVPQSLNTICESGAAATEIALMTGPQVLYTEHAVGISPMIAEKLRALVDGYGINRSGHAVKWRNVGSAYDSILLDPISKQAFGLEGWKAFKVFCEEVGIDKSVKKLGKRVVYLGESE